MSGINDKEKAHENKFAHDRDTQFKVHARRNKLLGLWVAEKVGLPADKREEYARTVVSADFEKPGDDDVLAKVRGDLEAAGMRLTDKEIREQMHRCGVEAKKQLTGS